MEDSVQLQNNKKSTGSKTWVLLIPAFVVMLLYYVFQNNSNLVDALRLGFISIIIIFILSLYIDTKRKKFENMPYFNTFMLGSYSISLLFVLLTKGNINYPIWLVGGLCLAICFDLYVGSLINFSLLLFASALGGLDMDSIFYIFILGTIFCMLSQYMYGTMIVYSTVIIISVQIVFQFIMKEFILGDVLNYNCVLSLVTTLLVIGLSNGVYYFYNHRLLSSEKIMREQKDVMRNHEAGQDTLEANLQFSAIEEESILRRKVAEKQENAKIRLNESVEEYAISLETTIEEQNLNEEQNLHEEKALMNENNENTDTNIDFLKESIAAIMNPEFDLLNRFREFAPSVYEHSLGISELAGRAACVIHADESIARAGGLYFEIGRMASKQYVEGGLAIAEEYDLPEVIKDIIKEHNLKYSRPKTIESAIVMLTISVVDSKEYLKKSKEKEQTQIQDDMNQGVANHNVLVSNEKIVNSVFQTRLLKGSLDDSGLNLAQYNRLKEFYLKEE